MKYYPTISVTGGGVDLRFVMTDGFAEGYTNKMDATDWQTVHPIYFWWQGGQFDEIPFQVTLAVDKDSLIATASALVKTVESVFKAALCPIPAGGGMNTLPDQSVTLQVSDWWKRDGYLKAVSVKWRPPWDILDGGKPMVADLQFTFVSDWLAKQRGAKTYEGLPTRTSFTFSGTK